MVTLRKISVAVGDNYTAGRVAEYVLDRGESPEAFVRAEDREAGYVPPANAMWLGSDDALAALGVERGAEVDAEELKLALQGQHVKTGAQVRQAGGTARAVANLDITCSAPGDLKPIIAQASEPQRAAIYQAMMEAANVAVEHLTQTKKVVHRRVGDTRVREEAVGMVGAASLHVTARPAAGEQVPSPQLHVHFMLLGVLREDGMLVTPDSWEMFRHDAALEAGAVFRCALAERLKQLGYDIRPETGKKGRFFEIVGVPRGLVERLSGRSRDVAEEIARQEALRGGPLTGGALSIVAALTRRPKDATLGAEEIQAVWDAICQEFEFGRVETEALVGEPGFDKPLDERRREWLEAFLRKLDERGPTVTRGTALATAYEVAAGRLGYRDVHAMLGAMEAAGELVALKNRRATSRQILELERQVLEVAAAAARRRRAPLSAEARRAGLEQANATLGEGKSLDDEQREAFERLTGGADWGILTGQAGTGKGPTLQAVAAAHVADGWQVIACAADGVTAQRLGEQIGAQAITIDQVLKRLELGALTVDENTLILIDEATKVRRGLWNQLASLVELKRARLIPIGHTGQLDAVEAPGMFAAMIRSGEIPVAELTEIRRHRDPDDPSQVHPWLRDYQQAVDAGRAAEAVELLMRNDALRISKTRREALEAMVDDWDVWRRKYGPLETLLVVHGSNADIAEANVLAQAKRIAAGEVGGPGLKAIEYEYELLRGDAVILRNAAYVFEADASGRRERRIENGQVGIVEAVDVEGDRVQLRLEEPGRKPRSVWLALAPLRERWAQGDKETPAVRLFYGGLPYPIQGATLRATATLGGHWSQGKEASYVADTRAVFQHTVYVSLEELNAVDAEKAVFELAKRMAKSRNRSAAITHEEDEGGRVNTVLPLASPVPPLPERAVQEPARAAATEAVEAEPRLEQELPWQEEQTADVEEELAADVRRDDVEVPDPFHEHAEALGKQRVQQLREQALYQAPRMRELDAAGLRAVRDAAAAAIDEFVAHRHHARETVSVERDMREREARLRESVNWADTLRERAKEAKGRERGEINRQIEMHERNATQDRERLEKLERRHERVREAWDFDEWMRDKGSQAAEWAAAQQELDALRAVEVEQLARRAPTETPEHIRDAIGARPATDSPLRGEWDELARDLERHRLRVVLAERDGEPVAVDRREQVELVERIREMQDARELEQHTQELEQAHAEELQLAEGTEVDGRTAPDDGRDLDR